ncbi:activated Cdc42 kinase-like isoform X5 [Toxorhynchites rutilus septentrionalis]|uniref:activated Cdc42 kinase-like isoform X5 n=1 Tax=Toxorhynchites rutilus septentrionalis TaxID=329112 RepID=UPI002479C0C6|nr:activated Cdc42 kinase-like isoform X5 [Toxorhynchites rutilus septentrionalis]
MEPKAVDLYEFLVESELQQYYNSLKNDLKITTIAHLKYATDEDLRQVCGLSRPEIRRLRKYYEKYYPHGYLNKIKRLLQAPKKDEGNISSPTSNVEPLKTCPSPSKIPNNKHIIPADAITVNKQLGTGEFGIVQQGVWTNGTERIQVAIKCLCRERMQSNPMEFLKEAAIMHSIEHENIVRLYGVVLDTESLMLVTELAHLRSLLECLKDPGLRVSFLTVPTLCEFAAQICNGMLYLENKRLIHRDLAARNILVFSKNKVKISDFGLSRALGVGKDYYQTNFNVNLKLPIAWCAPECINFLRFTNASDVWAYGVCLWEIFSYGFQPWAALTGHQILEAIDEPNYQRLEKPECCPKEYYSLMVKCWQHDAAKRPKFVEIYQLLPDMKPEQLKTIVSSSEMKKDHLLYRQGEIITVLDKNANASYWKGVLNSGKTGLFNPANTVAYLDSLPSSVNRDSFSRTAERTSKRKIRTDMISRPQNDLKHTGHVGIDGAYFGDVAFLASPQNLPRQIVTPYKPSEDLEQTPLLLPPTPTSPDSIQTASGYFSETLQTGHQSFVNAGENVDRSTVDSGLASAFDFRNSGFKDSNPFINADVNGDSHNQFKDTKTSDNQESHEYHEISDDDVPTEKVFDHGTSLLDEMEYMFKSMTTASEQQPPLSPDVENTNKRNELTELSSKLNRKNSSSSGTVSTKSGGKSKKKTSTVKPISVKDEKLLNQAIEIANEISAKSMTDLVSDSSQQTSSPKRKFSFRFPHIHGVVGGSSGGSGGSGGSSHHHSSGSGSVGAGGGSASGSRGSGSDKDHLASSSSGHHHNSGTLSSAYREKRNFSEEAKNVPDLHSTITEEHRQAYNSLVENPHGGGVFSDLKCFTASTLPRSRFNSAAGSFSSGTGNFRFKEIDLTTSPSHPAPKSPGPGSSGGGGDCNNQHGDESNPLRMLRSKNFPVVRPRLKIQTQSNADEHSVSLEDKDGPCESPSYLTNPEYTYNNATAGGDADQDTTLPANPIPLPPRDRNKVIAANPKRHVRKHPLIIPASGLQRTLSKVTQVTPIEEKSDVFTVPIDDSVNLDSNHVLQKSSSDSSKLNEIDHSYVNNNNNNHLVPQKSYAKEFVENNFPNLKHSPPVTTLPATIPATSTILTRRRNEKDAANRQSFPRDPTYENLDVYHTHQFNNNHLNVDTASLHCESILESDADKAAELASPSCSIDVVDSFTSALYDIESKKSTKLVEDVLRNVDVVDTKTIDKKGLLRSPLPPVGPAPTFNPTVAAAAAASSVTTAVATVCDVTDGPIPPSVSISERVRCGSGELKKSINYVSCEDLLEFAEKPKGRARGLESDEVRIMSKVLGKNLLMMAFRMEY